MSNKPRRSGLATGTFSGGLRPVTPGPDISDRPTIDRVSALGLTSENITPAVEARISWLMEEVLTYGQFRENPFELVAFACALEKEKDCRLLSLILDLAFKKIEEDREAAGHCSRLFSIMIQEIMPTLQDQSTTDPQGRRLQGASLFRKYLLDKWHHYTDKIWQAKETAVAYSALKPDDQEAAMAATEAVTQWITLLNFTDELRGLYILGESVIHEAITMQLSTAWPTEQEVSMLTRFTAPGGMARNYKLKSRLQEHYSKMQELAKRENLSQGSYKMLMRVLQDSGVSRSTHETSSKAANVLNTRPILKDESHVPMNPLVLDKVISSGTEDKKTELTTRQPQNHRHKAATIVQAEPSFDPDSLELDKFRVAASTPLSKILEFFTKISDTPVPDYTSELEHAECSDNPEVSGAMSDVWRARLRKGTHVAVKCTRAPVSSDNKVVKHTAKELGVWSRLRHTNILQLLGIALFRGKLVMVSEWMAKGSIIAVVNSSPDIDRYKLCAQVVEVVAWLYQEEIVHGDLKGANILMAENNIPKLTDFGLTIMREGSLQFSTTAQGGGTLRWMAPELFMGDAARSYKTDVYALGMTMLEIITGQVPFHEITNGHQIPVIIAKNKIIPKRPDCLLEKSPRNDGLWKAMQNCWVYDPKYRSTALEIDALVKLAVEDVGLKKSLKLGSNCCTMA